MPGPEDLSGYWSGWYSYALGLQQAVVPFTAMLSISANGDLTGSSLEPNTFALEGGEELISELNGVASAERVSYVKLYQPGRGVHQTPIRYIGEVVDDATRIIGQWTITQGHQTAEGQFELSRVSRSVHAEEQTSVHINLPSKP